MVNKENVQLIIDAITDEDNKVGFNMRVIAGPAMQSVRAEDGTVLERATRDKKRSRDCGTVACIAGHVAANFDDGKKRKRRLISHQAIENRCRGAHGVAQVFNISDAAANYLCYPGRTEGVSFEIWDKISLKEGVQVLKHLRDTGIVDWEITAKTGERLKKARADWKRRLAKTRRAMRLVDQIAI